MKRTAAHSATSINNTNHTQTLSPLQIGRDYFATAWRIAAPVSLAALLGAAADARLGTRPWATLLGLAVGFMAAGFLVKRQGGTSETRNKK